MEVKEEQEAETRTSIDGITLEEAKDFVRGAGKNSASSEAVEMGVMRERKFNWCAFFFSFVYCIYRKCYDLAAICIVIFLIMNWIGYKFADMKYYDLISLIVTIALDIAYGYAFYIFYRNKLLRVKESVQAIEDEEERNLAFRKQGGTSVLGLIIIIAAIVAFSIVLSMNIAA